MIGTIIFSATAGVAAISIACVRRAIEAEKGFPTQRLGDPDGIAEKLAYEAATRHGNIYVDQTISSAWAAMAFVETNASTRSVRQDENGNAVIVDNDGVVSVLSLYRDERGRFRYFRRAYLSPESMILDTPDSESDSLVIRHLITKAEKTLY